jgi:hypothetical protein
MRFASVHRSKKPKKYKFNQARLLKIRRMKILSNALKLTVISPQFTGFSILLLIFSFLNLLSNNRWMLIWG